MNRSTYRLTVHKRAQIFIAVIAVLSTLVLANLTISRGVAAEQAYSIRALSDADLRDQFGNRITASDLKDRLVLVNFFFTHCGNACPVQTAVLRDVEQQLDSTLNVLFVSVSISPLTDSADAINRYIEKFDIPQSRWKFATATPEKTNVLIENFRLTAAAQSHSGELLNHRNMGFLFGRGGTLMQQYQLTHRMSQRITREIEALNQLPGT